MDIIIPSKYIYESDNPKVRDNVYKRVDINAQKGIADNRFDITVFSQTEETTHHLNNLDKAQWQETLGYNYVSGSVTGIISKWASALVGARGVYLNRTFNIDKRKNNSYISFLKVLSENSLDGVGFSLQCRKYYGTGVATVRNGANPAVKSKTIKYSLPENESPLVTLSLDNVSVSQSIDVPDSFYIASATVDIDDNKDVRISVTDLGNILQVEIEHILICYESYWGTYSYQGTAIGSVTNFDYDINITAERYEPFSMEVSFQGNTIGINFEKETITVGEQLSKNALSISGNELIQSGNVLEYDVPYNRTSYSSSEVIEWGEYPNPVRLSFRINNTTYNYSYDTNKAIIDTRGYPFELISLTTYFYISDWYENILNQYKNGKETATLTCSMSQYKNTNGEVVIDANAYNLVDFQYFHSKNAPFEITTGSFILKSQSAISGVNTDFRYNGELQDAILRDGRIYINNQFASDEEISLRFTVEGDYGDSEDYDVQIDTSYLPIGRYTLSFKIDIGDTTAEIKDWQIESGKARAYQKPLKMHFSEGDIVVPMKYTANGTDKGISLYNNNPDTPKRFKVTGVAFVYDGVTRQKLTLQEI